MEQKKILFVEDDPSILELETAILQKLGFNVLSAGSAEEGLKMATSENPDALAIDITLPDRDGYCLAQELKAREDTKHIPIAFVTAKGSYSDMKEGFDSGGQIYLTKPFTVNGLRTAIQSLLGVGG